MLRMQHLEFAYHIQQQPRTEKLHERMNKRNVFLG